MQTKIPNYSIRFILAKAVAVAAILLTIPACATPEDNSAPKTNQYHVVIYGATPGGGDFKGVNQCLLTSPVNINKHSPTHSHFPQPAS